MIYIIFTMWLGTKQLKIHCWRVRSLSGIPKEILSIQEIDIKFTTASNESTRDSSPKKSSNICESWSQIPYPVNDCQWLHSAHFLLTWTQCGRVSKDAWTKAQIDPVECFNLKKNWTLKMTCVLNSCDIGSCVDLLKFNKHVSKMMNVLLHISWSRIN